MPKIRFILFALLLFLSATVFSAASQSNNICSENCHHIDVSISQISTLESDLEIEAYELRQLLINKDGFIEDLVEKQINEDNDIKPRYEEHHTCGYGGTSCRICYVESYTGWCGCVLQDYICCCGRHMGGKLIYCSQHP